MGHRVFISYAKKNRNVADAVCAKLESRGIACWYAPRNILAGTSWASAIVEGIDGSELGIVVLSSHSNRSRHVHNEIERIVSRGLPLIPFRVEDVEPSKDLELFLSSPHWLDAFTPPVEDHVERLVETVEAVLDGRTVTPPPPAAHRRERRSGVGVLIRPIAIMLVLAAGVVGSFAVLSSLDRGPTAEEIAERMAEAGGRLDELGDMRTHDHPSVMRLESDARAALRDARNMEMRGDKSGAFESLRASIAFASQARAVAEQAEFARASIEAVSDQQESVDWSDDPALRGVLLREVEAAHGNAREAYDAAVSESDFERVEELCSKWMAVIEEAKERTTAGVASVQARDACSGVFEGTSADSILEAHPLVRGAWESARSQADSAEHAFEEGDFEAAQDAWKAAKESAELATSTHRAARRAERQLDGLEQEPVASSDEAPSLARCRALRAKAEEQYESGAFLEIEALVEQHKEQWRLATEWQGIREELVEALRAADALQDKLPATWLPSLVVEVETQRRIFTAARESLRKRELKGVTDEVRKAITSLESCLERHAKARGVAEAARSRWSRFAKRYVERGMVGPEFVKLAEEAEEAWQESRFETAAEGFDKAANQAGGSLNAPPPEHCRVFFDLDGVAEDRRETLAGSLRNRLENLGIRRVVEDRESSDFVVRVALRPEPPKRSARIGIYFASGTGSLELISRFRESQSALTPIHADKPQGTTSQAALADFFGQMTNRAGSELESLFRRWYP